MLNYVFHTCVCVRVCACVCARVVETTEHVSSSNYFYVVYKNSGMALIGI